MCDILVHDSKSSACLNDEQKSLLAAFEQKGTNVTQYRTSKRYNNITDDVRDTPTPTQGSVVLSACQQLTSHRSCLTLTSAMIGPKMTW